MATLTSEQRIIVGLEILQVMCKSEDVDCTQATVRDAVLAAAAAADDWAEEAKGDAAPTTGYNGALPEPFRSWATAQQKAQVLTYVLLHRFNLNV